MVLQYNPVKGKIAREFPEILSKGDTPLPFVEIILNREEITKSEGDVSPDTSDLFISGDFKRGNEFYVILPVSSGRISECGRRALEYINPESRHCSGSIILEESAYEELRGLPCAVRFSRKEVGDELNFDNRLVRVLLRDPSEVDKEFAYERDGVSESLRRIEEIERDRFGSGRRIYPANPQKFPAMWVWSIHRLESKVDAYGMGNFHLEGGYLMTRESVHVA